ncbi:protein CBFA2T3-like [Conger conger]|uniref:protein CBFA2T3-like n=1 Tax=Conger conger TaxID=82655 RepID=UPI002A5A9D93|nr:protein CBFA2T3-like [Conger conger]
MTVSMIFDVRTQPLAPRVTGSNKARVQGDDRSVGGQWAVSGRSVSGQWLWLHPVYPSEGWERLEFPPHVFRITATRPAPGGPAECRSAGKTDQLPNIWTNEKHMQCGSRELTRTQPHLLNCIMDMVEKTRRSLTVLRRCQEADREEMNHWIRRYSDVEDMKKEIHRDFLHRPSSGYLPEEIWRKAGPTGIPLSPALKQLQSKQEEAVNEVKRQALSELQKAVSDAERKAHEMISVERSKMERVLAEAKRQASEDALTVINQQEDSSESCWNCGRKASETCSGCNTARYCGSFCQHKDWEKHHHVCGLPGGSRAPQGTPCSSSAAPPTHTGSVPPASLSLPGQAGGGSGPSVSGSPKEPSSSGASRSTTPATPALLDSASR